MWSYSFCLILLLSGAAVSLRPVNFLRRSTASVASTTLLSAIAGSSQTASISLVGAGPGDPDLLTMKALKLIKAADLVISDRLVSPELLRLVACELLIANKKPGCAEDAQEEIYQWVRDAVAAGKKIVRLKIGDPFLFGRGGEEILEFRKLGICD